MADLIILFIWSLIVFSATNIVAVSKIFYGFRTWLTYKTLKKVQDERGVRYEGELRKIQFFSSLVHCPMCLGFWFGMLASIFVISPTNSLLLGDNEIANVFSDGLLGSILSWIYYLIIKKPQGTA
jgi:hypothetical protein